MFRSDPMTFGYIVLPRPQLRAALEHLGYHACVELSCFASWWYFIRFWTSFNLSPLL